MKQIINADYGPDNPEPIGLKDSAMVRDPSKDALHAAMEYILATPATELAKERPEGEIDAGGK